MTPHDKKTGTGECLRLLDELAAGRGRHAPMLYLVPVAGRLVANLWRSGSFRTAFDIATVNECRERGWIKPTNRGRYNLTVLGRMKQKEDR